MKNYCRKGLVRHVGKSWMAMSKGKDLPDLPKEDDKFIKRVTFFEVVTESLPQLTFSNMIIRLYGVSDNPVTKFFQLFSLASSMFSLVISFITVSKLFASINLLRLLTTSQN